MQKREKRIQKTHQILLHNTIENDIYKVNPCIEAFINFTEHLRILDSPIEDKCAVSNTPSNPWLGQFTLKRMREDIRETEWGEFLREQS